MHQRNKNYFLSIAGFIGERIEKCDGKTVGKKILNDRFNEWFKSNYGSRKPPKMMELEEAMNKRFATTSIAKKETKKWINIQIKTDSDELDEANPMFNDY